MTDERELDTQLRTRFEEMRRSDASSAPPFAPMLARAVAAAAPAPKAVTPITPLRHWSRGRLVMWGAPILVAASFGAIWVVPKSGTDREFERVVSEWSRTEAALSSPTDALLAVPGSEFLGRVPSLGGSAMGKGS